MQPKWTILVATLGQRGDRLQRLMEQLLPQVDKHDGAVTVSALWNNGERPLSHVRQALVDNAQSEYISFIDDDDMVPEDFVDTIVPLLDGVDYVGWQMQTYVDGVALKPTFHSLRYDHWWDDSAGYYRDVSHLNPISTLLARQVDFRRTSPPEDVAWVDQIRPFVLTEHYVGDGKIMYYYQSSTGDSTWQPGSVTPGDYARVQFDSPFFSYHPESS